MFQKIKTTAFPPTTNTLVWDGKCGFCKYWKTRWQLQTPENIIFAPYQEVAKNFEDIPLKTFKTSSKLIETDGQVYSGPDSAYRSLWHAGHKRWHKLYHNSSFFEKLSDVGYNHIVKHRSFYYKLTVFCFGKNPKSPVNYWLIYLSALILLILIFCFT